MSSAMRSLKVNFTVPHDVAERLKERVGKRKRSAFVAEAIRDKLRELEEQELQLALKEGYIARRQDDVEINEEWEGPTLEGWDDTPEAIGHV